MASKRRTMVAAIVSAMQPDNPPGWSFSSAYREIKNLSDSTVEGLYRALSTPKPLPLACPRCQRVGSVGSAGLCASCGWMVAADGCSDLGQPPQ
jgi:hypothetical protein